MHMMIRVSRSTIVEPFKAGVFCFEALSLCDKSLHPVKNKVDLCPQLLNLFRAFTTKALACANCAIAITPKHRHNVFVH
jgi:hypothetical protein